MHSVAHPSAHAVVLRLAVPDRVEHLPGQHYVIRLTAKDGYVAQRSYSIASAPGDPLLELWIERLDDGEVSGFLADVVQPGDDLDVRGPIGGWFVWDATGPAVGVAGGSGAVPLRAMLRHAQALGRESLLRFAVAARTVAELPYAAEFGAAGAMIALSRAAQGARPPGRLRAAEITSLVRDARRATYYVCGSAAFAEAAGTLLVDAGVDEHSIRVERFGPSG